jgi:ribosomal protein S18 acetylase RimI-like enzyme
VIRPATEADLPALAAMMAAFEAYLNTIDPGNPSAVGDAARAAVARFALGPAPCRGVFLAERDAKPVGFLAWQEIVWMDDGAPALWVSDLYVAPEARGIRVGEALMDAARAAVRERGGRRVVFTVWDGNAAARAFYAALGAEPVGGEILLSLSA